MADENAKIKIDTTVDNEGLEKGLKSASKTVKGFAKGFASELAGIDGALQAVAGGPAAVGQAVAKMARDGVAELNEYAESWRKADEAAQKLAYAAEGNPYLNGKAVKALQAFADELEAASGLDGEMIVAAETRLAALGRDQKQITKILRTAADLDAAGLMSFDEAVAELNSSYNGLARASARLLPEIKSLTQEDLAAGKAVDLLAEKVEGGAARAMVTASGSVKAYEKAVGDLKKAIGGGWEEATRPAREWVTEVVSGVNDALSKRQALYEAIADKEITAAELAEINADAARALGEEYAAVLNGLEGAQGYLEGLGKTQSQWVGEQISLLSDMTGKTRGQIADLAKTYGEFGESVRGAITEALNFEIAEAERERSRKERDARIAAADKQAKDAQQQRIADGMALEDITKKNKEALEAEIGRIKELARINGKNVESAEVQRQMLDARINAYYSLLEEGKEHLQLVQQQEEGALATLEAEGRRVGALAEAERLAAEAAQEEERRNAERIQGIDAAIEAQDRLAQSMLELAGGAALEDEKNLRIAALKETLLAEEAAEDERLALHKTGIDLAATMSEKGLDARLAQRIAEIAAEEEYALKALQKELDERRKASEQAIADINGNETLSAEEKAAKIQRINDGMFSAEESFNQYRLLLWRQTEDKIVAAHEGAAKTMEEREKEKYEKMAASVGEYSGCVREAAQAIYEIWSNAIQSELDERLAALDQQELSAEEREAAEKELRKTAADEQYKAAAFQWSLNMALAAANSGGPAGVALAAVAGAIGALQVAAVAGAKPKKQTFHSGGVVAGSGEVDAALLGGEVVQTSAQFKSVMDAFSNLAGMNGPSAAAPTIVINNNAPGARADQPQIDNNKIIVTIRQIVSETIASGEANGAFARKDSYDRGQSLMTF
jgi:hypothetical protein